MYGHQDNNVRQSSAHHLRTDYMGHHSPLFSQKKSGSEVQIYSSSKTQVSTNYIRQLTILFYFCQILVQGFRAMVWAVGNDTFKEMPAENGVHRRVFVITISDMWNPSVSPSLHHANYSLCPHAIFQSWSVADEYWSSGLVFDRSHHMKLYIIIIEGWL